MHDTSQFPFERFVPLRSSATGQDPLRRLPGRPAHLGLRGGGRAAALRSHLDRRALRGAPEVEAAARAAGAARVARREGRSEFHGVYGVL